MTEPNDRQDVTAKRMRDRPGETAVGRIDSARLPERERDELAGRVPCGDEEFEDSD